MFTTFSRIQNILQEQGFTIIETDFKRPWGGFFVIEPKEAPKFIETYFPKELWQELHSNLNVRPKILMVAPHKRLSWQYHLRRSEVWSIYEGPVGIIQSNTDAENEVLHYNKGECVTLTQGTRHRLIGLDTVGIVAEIWQHKEELNPSDENDIIRIQDDFGR